MSENLHRHLRNKYLIENKTPTHTYVCMHVCRLAMESMSREAAESRLRLLEDQLAELQEELRRVSEASFHPGSLQTVNARTQTIQRITQSQT